MLRKDVIVSSLLALSTATAFAIPADIKLGIGDGFHFDLFADNMIVAHWTGCQSTVLRGFKTKDGSYGLYDPVYELFFIIKKNHSYDIAQSDGTLVAGDGWTSGVAQCEGGEAGAAPALDGIRKAH